MQMPKKSWFSKKKRSKQMTLMIDKAQLIALVQNRIHANNNFWEEEVLGVVVDEGHEGSSSSSGGGGSGNVADAQAVCDAMLEDDAQLERLLVARKYDGEATANLFWEQVRFRARHKPTETDPTTIPNALPSGAWRLAGFTKQGQVISNYKLEFWKPDLYGDLDKAVAEYTRYVCYMIELMICSTKLPQDKYVVIFDLKGFYMTMVTKTNVRMMIRKLIYIAQSQYPERLEKVYLINAPYGFETAWSVIQSLLDAKTASKIKFCETKDLLDDIDAEVLSVTYGGTHEEYPVPSKTIQDEAYK